MSTTIQQLAAEVSAMFESRTRPSGEEFRCLKDEAPEWMSGLVMEAHGAMMPNDWRYRLIEKAVDALAEEEDEDAARNSLEPSIYTSELCDWLASSVSRPIYCDEAAENGLVGENAGMVDRMQAGQLEELHEVFALVFEALEERAEEMEEDECECEDGPLAGALLMNTFDDERENVERCDLCKRFGTDEEAAEALRALGWTIEEGALFVVDRPEDQ